VLHGNIVDIVDILTFRAQLVMKNSLRPRISNQVDSTLVEDILVRAYQSSDAVRQVRLLRRILTVLYTHLLVVNFVAFVYR
jgi:hypothetical protein